MPSIFLLSFDCYILLSTHYLIFWLLLLDCCITVHVRIPGSAVCPGRDTGLYDSFSILLSPLLSIPQNTSIVFDYSQWLPGKLSVFLGSKTGLVEVYSGQDFSGSRQYVVYIVNSSVAKVCLPFSH